MTTKDLIAGETRHFKIFPKDNSTVEGLKATYKLISLKDSERSGTLSNSLDNKSFTLIMPTDSLQEGLYELRVFVSYLDSVITTCVYAEKINVKK